MILKLIRDSRIEKVEETMYDLFITSSGYETRASYLARNYNIRASEYLCLRFNSQIDIFAHTQNDQFYTRHNYTIVNDDGSAYEGLKFFLLDFIKRFDRTSLKILVDYSSMSRVWYSYILSFFEKMELSQEEVTLCFSYTHSIYEDPPAFDAYRSHISPIEGYYSILPPIKPTALIIGLGYLRFQALGLTEYFEAEPYTFINRPSMEDRFYLSVMENNELLLQSVHKSNIYYYSIYQLEFSYKILHVLCKDLQSSKRIVMAPCGPKPFTLLCLLTSLSLGNIDVWRISANHNDAPVDKVENGELSIVDVTFVK